MFGKRKTTNTNSQNVSKTTSKAVRGSDMTSGSRSTKSASNSSARAAASKAGSAKATTNKASTSKACGGKCKTQNKTTKSCS